MRERAATAVARPSAVAGPLETEVLAGLVLGPAAVADQVRAPAGRAAVQVVPQVARAAVLARRVAERVAVRKATVGRVGRASHGE